MRLLLSTAARLVGVRVAGMVSRVVSRRGLVVSRRVRAVYALVSRCCSRVRSWDVSSRACLACLAAGSGSRPAAKAKVPLSAVRFLVAGSVPSCRCVAAPRGSGPAALR